jgi:hypothetical protein
MDTFTSIYFYKLEKALDTVFFNGNPKLFDHVEDMCKTTKRVITSHVFSKVVVVTKEDYENLLLNIAFSLTTALVPSLKQMGGDRQIVVQRQKQRGVTAHKFQKIKPQKEKRATRKRQELQLFHNQQESMRNNLKIAAKRLQQYGEELSRETGPGELVHPNNSIITFNSLPKYFSKAARHRHLRRLTREGFRTSLSNNNDLFFKYYFLLFFVKVVRIVEKIQHFTYARTPFLLESSPTKPLLNESTDESAANKSHIPSTVSNSTVVAVLNPEMAAYELASAVSAQTDYFTKHYMSSNTNQPLRSCPLSTLDTNSNLRFKREDLQIVNSLNILSAAIYDVGEFSGHIINRNGILMFDGRLQVGKRGSVTVSRYWEVDKSIVAKFHMHPHSFDRLESPPSFADVSVTLTHTLLDIVPYHFVFTHKGIYIIKFQDNFINALFKWVQDKSVAGHDRQTYLDTVNVELEKIQATYEKNSHFNCFNQQSGHINFANNLMTVPNPNNLAETMVTGIDILFVSNKDLLDGKMPPLPLAAQAQDIRSKVPRSYLLDLAQGKHIEARFVPAPQLNGLSGTQLIAAFVDMYDPKNTEVATFLRNTTQANEHDFSRMWHRIKMNPTLENEYQAVIFKNYTRIMGHIMMTDTEILQLTANKNYKEKLRILQTPEVLEIMEREIIKFIRRPGYLNDVNALREYLALPNGEARPTATPMPVPTQNPIILTPMPEPPIKQTSIIERVIVTLLMGGAASFFIGGTQSIVQHKRPHKSILDTPGFISKMILSNKVTETIFMDLPYPLHILKKYI